MDYMPKVLQAVAGEDNTVYLYFSDGSVRLYDAKPLLKLGGVFEPLKDPDFFRSRLTVLNDTAAWDVTGNMDPCGSAGRSILNGFVWEKENRSTNV